MAPTVDKEACIAEAKAYQVDIANTLAMQGGGSSAQRAYLERLGRAALEAAEKGYGIRRATLTTQRTRMVKTTTKTNMQTRETETTKEQSCTIEKHYAPGSPARAGVSVIRARGTRVMDHYSDGTTDLADAAFKCQAVFVPTNGVANGGEGVERYEFDSRATGRGAHCGT